MKPMQIVLIVCATALLVSCGYAVYELGWGSERLEISGRSLPELLGSDVLVVILGAIVALGVTFLVVRPFARFIFPPQIKDGVEAVARVLKVWDTGTTINDDPEVGLLLEFTSPEGAPLQVEARTVVSRLQVALVQPGIEAEIRYDPHKPRRLRVLTLHVPEIATRSAAARMEELKELRDKDLISAEEYERKREEILRGV